MPLLGRLLAKADKKLLKVALPPLIPREPAKVWKLDSREDKPLEDEELEDEESSLIRLCKSFDKFDCEGGRFPPAPETDDVLLLPSLSPSLSVPLLCECKACIKFCMKTASACCCDELKELVEVESVELPVKSELLVEPVDELLLDVELLLDSDSNALKMEFCRPPLGGGPGGGGGAPVPLVLPTPEVELD